MPDSKLIMISNLRSKGTADRELVGLLNQRLKDLETQSVPVWQRPIQEVARLAILQEITAVGRRIARAGVR